MTKKDVRILAFESSCDETSTAVIKNGREIESLIVATQIKSHQRFGGVVPEVASRHHIEVITQITKEALAEANTTWDDIDAIAVTYGPGLVGALLIGVSAAKAASMATGIPLHNNKVIKIIVQAIILLFFIDIFTSNTCLNGLFKRSYTE